MQWIFLIGDATLTLSRFEQMRFPGSTRTVRSGEQLLVMYENGDYAAFFREENTDAMRSEFEPGELEKLLAFLPFDDPKWIMLKYRNIETVKQILQAPDFPKDVFIDCDGTDPGLEAVFDRARIIGTAAAISAKQHTGTAR